MLKKICSLALAVTILLSCCVCLYAQEISLYDIGSDRARSTLSFSGRTATCTSSFTGYSGVTTKIIVSQTLEKKDGNGDWQYSCGWSTTIDSYKGSVTNYAYNRSTGVYRLTTVFTVYSGNSSEPITIYSSEQTVS